MIAGAVIGLIGGILPEAVKLLQRREDYKHEKEMMELQLQYAKQVAELQIEQAKAMADIEADKAAYEFAKPQFVQTSNWFINLLQVINTIYNGSVRPTITYFLVFIWACVKYAVWQGMGGKLIDLPAIWTEWDNEFVAAVIMFWFAGRGVARAFGRIT